MSRTYLFLGMGLIGGSIAKSLRKLEPDATILAYTRHRERLEKAVKDGVLNRVSETLTADVPASDIIFLCAPTGTNLSNLKIIAPLVHEKALITDVGSVKHDIQKAADFLGISRQFLGGHPMTGKETTGYESADEQILENAYYILTPSTQTRSGDLAFMIDLVKGVKSIPLIIDPMYHDYAAAAISHLPHLIAASLVDLVRTHDNEEQFMKTIAAGGFKDITRIASSDPDMWANICKSNRENIRLLLDQYIDCLQEISGYLDTENYEKIRELFAVDGAYRNGINNRRGSLPGEYRLFVDIPDKTGAIAGIATLLAGHSINIKNIGITHNRELSEGALVIVFYDEASKEAAIPVIRSAGYPVILL